MVKGLFLDFGGVIADEGYREGLFLIAERHGIDKGLFFSRCADLIYETGYIIGECGQDKYFEEIRNHFHINTSDREFESILLSSFRIRKPVLETVEKIRTKGIITAILSDQTDWLDKLNEQFGFFRYFDFVFNSYHIKMGKRDINTFRYVANKVSLPPSEILFIDDQKSNIDRAVSAGIRGICLTEENEIINFLKNEFSGGI
ncbi:MAG: HAD-IA family hydrolase [Deltaproteobacteria bacterium]|nr:HAD-IA family hydrolase [Deltaproteobacteria bacterium]